jgi:hypothetical protein
MDIIKIQQDLLKEMPDAVRPPVYIPLKNNITVLIPCAHSCGFLIPNKSIYLDLAKGFTKVEKQPFNFYEEGKWTELVDTGMTKGEGSQCRKIFKRGDQTVLLAKNLLKHFAKGAKFYQEKDLNAVAVIEAGEVVAYVLPCRTPKEENG